MERDRINKLLMRIVFITIGLLIIYGLIQYIGFDKLWENLGKADLKFVLLAFILFVSVMVIKIVRWSNLFTEVRFTDSAKIFSMGMIINETLPIGSGEFTRGFVAKTKFGVPFGKTLAPALIERISDVTFLFALTLMFILIFLTGQNYIFILTFVIILLAIVYTLLFKPGYIDKLILKISHFSDKRSGVISRILDLITKFLGTFKDALLKFHKKPMIITYTIFLTIFAWSVEAFGQWTLLSAFGYGGDVNYFTFLALVGTSWIIGTFSFLPGGLGVREFVFATMLSGLYGIPVEMGISIALVYRFLNYILLTSFAMASFSTLPKKDFQTGENDKGDND